MQYIVKKFFGTDYAIPTEVYEGLFSKIASVEKNDDGNSWLGITKLGYFTVPLAFNDVTKMIIDKDERLIDALLSIPMFPVGTFLFPQKTIPEILSLVKAGLVTDQKSFNEFYG